MNLATKLTIISLLFTSFALAQPGKCPQLPEEYKWEDATDYKKDEDLVKKTLRWLCNTPLGLDVMQRSTANAFVLEWLAGTPDLLIEIHTDRLPFGDVHPELIYTYIHGVALFRLEKPNSRDELQMAIAGYNAVASLASQSNELSHDSALRQLLKAYRKDKMKNYVQSFQSKNREK